MRGHAEILITLRIRRWQRIKPQPAKAGAGQERLEPFLGIQPLGVELVGNHAAPGIDHDFAADQPVMVFGKAALAADEPVPVDPFPRARLEVTAHPVAVHQIHDQLAAAGQRPLDPFENGEIVFLPLEIAKGIAEDAYAIEFAVAEAKIARVAFVKRWLLLGLLGALAREADQIARAIEPSNALKTAPRQLERMAPLPAAQIENAMVRFQPGAGDQQIDFFDGVALVFEYVAVGFEIEGVEQRAPPIGRQMVFKVGNRTRCPGAVAPPLARLGTVQSGDADLSGPQGGGLPAHAPAPLTFIRTSKKRLPISRNRQRTASPLQGGRAHRS